MFFLLRNRQIDLNERRSRRDMSPQGRKRVAGMVSRDYQTVSGIGGSTHYQVSVDDYVNIVHVQCCSWSLSADIYVCTMQIINFFHFPTRHFQSHLQRRNEAMSMSHRSQSAAPSSYGGERRGSLSPPDDRYLTGSKDYPVLPIHQQQSSYTPQFKSRSATATPTGSPKKRQLPKVPQIQRNSTTTARERLMQDFEDRSLGGRRSRGMRHHIPQYRSTAHGGS